MLPKQAKSTAESAFRELTHFIQVDLESVDPFTLARLEKAATDGMKSNVVMAYQAFGLICRYRWDNDGVDEYFKLALRTSNDSSIMVNYASTLMSLNRFAEAATWSESASRATPENLNFLRTAVEANWYAGRYDRSLELIDTLCSRALEPNLPADMEHRRQMVSTLHRCEVSLDTVERLHSALYKFLADNNIISRGALSYIDNAPGEESVFVTITIDRDEEEVRRLDEQLTPILFDSVEHFPLGSFSIGLEKLEAEHAS